LVINQDKEDRRIKRTNKLLQDALISLTLEKGYNEITIREITERADVGYATFFRHYPDKDALLAAVLHSMKDEFQDLFKPSSIYTDPVNTGKSIFEYVQQNEKLCVVLLNSTELQALLRPIDQIGLQEATRYFGNSTDTRVPIEIAANHLISSLIMLIRWWLDHNKPFPPDRMGQIAAELIIYPVLHCMSGSLNLYNDLPSVNA